MNTATAGFLRRTGTRAIVGSAVLTLALGGVVVPPTLVSAAPLVTGAVINDANADGIVNSAVGTGPETGFGGITVELVETGGGTVVDSTTTDGSGNYVLDAGADGTYVVRVTTPAGYVVNTLGDGGAGSITRTSPTTGESDPIVLAGSDAVLADALMRPDFELQLGYIAPPDGVITGASPFDTTDPACVAPPLGTDPGTGLNDYDPLPGNDCARNDDNVRSGDNVTFNYTYSGSAYDDTVPSATDVVIQQTITPVANGLGVFPVINYTRIPAICTPGNGGGAPPPFSKVEYESSPGVWVEYAGAGTGYVVPADPPAGSLGKRLRITCNKGTVATGDAGTLGITVRVDGTAPEGSSFTTEAIIFAVDDAGNATAVADDPLAAPPITIKARPEWDVRKSGFYRQDWTSMDPDAGGPLPTMPGFYTYFSIMIGTDRKAGNEPLAQPIVLNDQLSFFRGDGTTPVALTLGTDYFIQDCRDFWPQGLGTFSNNVISKPSLATAPYTASMAVQDSGTCTFNPATGDLTLSGIDFGGPYPTTTNTGQSLAAGPYLVANKWVRVFIPASTLDDLFGDAPANEAGSGFFWNRVDYQGTPLGVSGSQNFNGNPEPGDCDLGTAIVPSGPGATTGCDPLAQSDLLFATTRSNNVAGPTNFVFSPGTFSKYLLKPNNKDRSYVLHDDMTAAHSGDGTIQPGTYTSTWLHWQSLGTSYEDPEQCDIWDNTMYLLVPLATAGVGSNSGTSSSLYATATGANTNPGLLVYEYASIPITGDDPLINGLNGTTGRYEGVWTDQRASNCDEPGITWYTDPNSVPGGIDNVNAVRVSGPGSNDPTPLSPTMTPGSDRLLRVGLLARDTFYGGPHDGEAIPAGAVGANYGKVKSSNRNGGVYTSPSYQPSPETANTDGDRLTWTRAVLGVKKNTIEVDGMCASPCAQPVDVNGQILAGRPVIWQIQPVLNAASSAPAPVPDLVVTDILPVFVEYDEACTIGLTGGTPANDVQLNTPGPGQTTLVWNLGTLTPNQPITPLIICTQTDSLAPAPTSVTNTVRFSTTAIPMSKPSDIHTLTLEQSGELKLRKSVDAPLDPLNDDQVWTVSYANFSDTISFGPVRTIEVFPYMPSDFAPLNGPQRNPASDFEGALELTAQIDPKYPNGDDVPGTAYYTADPPASISNDWNLNTANWCTFANFGNVAPDIDGSNAGGCPATLADVTGWMFVEDNALGLVNDATRNRVNIPFTLQAGDPGDPFGPDANAPGDRYTNRFTAQVPQILRNGLPQRLDSNTVRVRVVGYSLGDWIWFDRNDDGIYTPGTDFVVPDGVTVELFTVGTDGNPETGDEVLLGTTTTVGGQYLFTDLPDGEVYIKIPASEFNAGGLLYGFEITGAAAGDEDDNDDVSHDAVLPPTASDPTDNGVISTVHTLEPPVIVNGLPVGSEPSGENNHAILDTTTSDRFSNLTIDMALTGVGSIGDRVWFDNDGDTTDNGGTEVGIPNVPVTVTWFGPDGVEGGGDDLVFTTTTDADGYYLVDNLPFGNYEVELGDLADELTPTYDLDGIGTPGVALATLDVVEPDRTDVDFGYSVALSLGDRLWADVDGNGIYTPGLDVPLANVTIELWAEFGVAPITEVVTDANGNYLFAGLPPGNYFVRIPPAEFTSGDLVGYVAETAGYSPTPNNNNNETSDHNAAAGTGGETISGVVTGPITLSVTFDEDLGTVVGDEPQGSGFANLTLDLALRGTPRIDIVKEVCNPAAGGGSCDPGAALGADGWNDVSYNATFLEDITWRITVTNTGMQVLSNLVVTDPQVAACATPAAFTPPATLGLNASFSYTCVTNDLIVGFTNTATVTGISPSNVQVTDNDPAQVTTPSPVQGIEMEKYVIHTDFPAIENDADDAPGIQVPVGDQVTWVYDVFLPDGVNVPLSNVTVSDNGGPFPTFSATYQSGDTDGDGFLEPGETWRFVAPSNLTVTAGQYTNVATARGTPVSPSGQSSIVDTDPANHFGVNAAILVIKSTNGQDANTPYGPILAPGAPVTWTYLVRNTGNVPLVDVTVVDDQGVVVECGANDADDDGDIDFLDHDVAFQVTCTGNGTAVPGQYTNIATVEGIPADDNGEPLLGVDGNQLPHPTDTDPSNYFSPQPSIDLVKTTQTIDSDTITGPFVATGDDVLWTFTVTNTGNTALRNVTVTDDMIANDATIDCDGDNVIALMVPGEVVTCTVLGTAIEGQYENTGSVTGQPVMPTVPPSDPNDPDTFPTDPAAYSPVVLTGTTAPLANVTDTNPDHYFGVNPSVSIVKSTNGEDADEPYGPFVLHPDTVTWTYEVTNDGNTALLDVTVLDDMIADDATAIDCGAGSNVIALMVPGQTVTCTATGPSELGQYTNLGSVSGDPAFPDPSFVDDPGFDPADPDTWPTNPGDFDPIATTDTTGATTDVDNVTDENPSNYFGALPGISLVKTTQTLDNDTIVGPFVEIGTPVMWTYTITNTGNTALSNVTVVDDMLADDTVIDCDGVDNTIALMVPGEVVVCTAFGIAEAGQYANVGDVTGTPTMPDQDSFDDPTFDPDDPDTWPTNPAEFDPVVVDGEPLPDETDTNPDHYFGVDASVDVEKSTNTFDADDPFGPFVDVDGDVEWTYTVTNTGNVALLDVEVVDDMIDAADIDCGAGTNVIGFLMPGDTVTCTATGTATAGQYSNIVDVEGQPVFPDPSYFDDPGFDPDDPTTWPTDPEEYDLIETTDINGETTPMEPVSDDDPSHYYGTDPSVEVVKYTNGQDANVVKGPFIPVGSTVTWTFEVTNTGNTALLDVTVTDDQIANDATAIDCGAGSNVIDLLLPGETVTCTASAPAVEGQYTNIGTVTGDPAMPDPSTPGLDPDDPETWPTDPDDYTPAETTDTDGSTTDVPNVTDDDPSNYFGAAPEIDIVKQVCILTDQTLCDIDNDAHWGESMVITQGTTVNYRITVTNTGNVDLAPVTVSDPDVADCDATFPIIEVGEQEVYTCQLDPVPGQLTNTATATGNPVDDDGGEIIDPDTDEPMDDVTDDDDAFVQLPPNVTILKAADKATVANGGVVTYTLTASNQGLGPAAGVVVVDTLPVGMVPTILPPTLTYDPATRELTWVIGTLQPGAMVQVQYTVKVTKVGTLVNVVVVESETPGDPPADNDDETPVVVIPPSRIPETGADSAPILWWAAGLSLAGLAVVFGARRRRRAAA